eukprot:COSAG01_NODE_3053_length_6660_cov_12.248133_1_plen_393_part_00
MVFLCVAQQNLVLLLLFQSIPGSSSSSSSARDSSGASMSSLRPVAASVVQKQNGGQSWASWTPTACRMASRFAADVDPRQPLPEYPRPQMTRPDWVSLNGLWTFEIPPATDVMDTLPPPRRALTGGEVLVPFPIEAPLSGVGMTSMHLFYRRSFTAPAPSTNSASSGGAGERTLLHFGAIDWKADVYVNGHKVVTHSGGFDPFSADITEALASRRINAPASHELVVSVFDPQNHGPQPFGKQSLEMGMFWQQHAQNDTVPLPQVGKNKYTTSTGIWGSVWLEVVPACHIEALVIKTSLAALTLDTVPSNGCGSSTTAPQQVDVIVHAPSGRGVLASGTGIAGQSVVVNIPSPQLWSPLSPFLYNMTVQMGADLVGSYHTHPCTSNVTNEILI